MSTVLMPAKMSPLSLSTIALFCGLPGSLVSGIMLRDFRARPISPELSEYNFWTFLFPTKCLMARSVSVASLVFVG